MIRFKLWLESNSANFITLSGLIAGIWAMVLLLDSTNSNNIGWIILLNIYTGLSDLADG